MERLTLSCPNEYIVGDQYNYVFPQKFEEEDDYIQIHSLTLSKRMTPVCKFYTRMFSPKFDRPCIWTQVLIDKLDITSNLLKYFKYPFYYSTSMYFIYESPNPIEDLELSIVYTKLENIDVLMMNQEISHFIGCKETLLWDNNLIYTIDPITIDTFYFKKNNSLCTLVEAGYKCISINRCCILFKQIQKYEDVYVYVCSNEEFNSVSMW